MNKAGNFKNSTHLQAVNKNITPKHFNPMTIPTKISTPSVAIKNNPVDSPIEAIIPAKIVIYLLCLTKNPWMLWKDKKIR